MFDWVEPNKNRDKLLLFCPVETKARELDAKVLLACVAAERGHKVVVGNMGELRSAVEYLPRGIYLSKSIPEKMEKVFQRYKSLGYGVTAWCEEGLVFLSRDDYKRKMVAPETLHYADLFFAWGGNQARAIEEKAPEARDKIRQVGNARLDMLRAPYRDIYAGEVERLRAVHGRFILFNTNFSIVNSMLGAEQAFLNFKGRGKAKTKEHEEHYWQHYEHKRAIFEAMGELIGTVSRAHPDKRIIVRPHPSENHETWRAITDGLDNAEVAYEGTVIPWLMAADVLIHNGCTTGVEAYFLETPAIAYRPVIKEGYELELPNSVSIRASEPDEVLEMIAFASRKSDDYEQWRRAAREELAAHVAEPDGAFSCDRIVAALEEHYSAHPVRPEKPMYRFARRTKRRSKDALKRLGAIRGAKPSEKEALAQDYRRQKFPGSSLDEMQRLVDGLRQVSGRFENVAVQRAGGMRHCYVVESS